MKQENKINEKKDITIRSSAAEYLTYIASSGEVGIEIRYENENIWLTQKMLPSLYNVKQVQLTNISKKYLRIMN